MVFAYVLIVVSPGSERTTCTRLSKMKEVVEVNEIYGEYDIIAKVSMASLPELDSFLTDKIRNLTDVKLTSTMLVSHQYKTSK